MGIDYVIDLDCDVKRALSTEGLVGLVKAKSRANAVLAIARESGDERPQSQITFDVAINRNGKYETASVSVQQLLDQAAALEDHRDTCAECPANLDNPNGFGCYRSIGYPLEPDTENFLLSRLPDKLDSAAGYLFACAMRDFAWDGDDAASMRAQGDTFFRLREAPERRWPELTISADQLFHMMFHVGHLQASHALMLCTFFGMLGLDDDDDSDDVRKVTVEVESNNAHQMIEFLNTLAFAAGKKLDVLIDG